MKSKQSGMFLTIGMCILLLMPLARGQEFRGMIQGLVTDQSQAVVPGATVTLHNVKTGVEATKVTNSQGLYRFDDVDSGDYILTVELAGFSKFIQENITVQAKADVTVNAVLKVGGVNQTVTVSESPVAVAFNTSDIALTVDSKIASELPHLDRNPFKLSYLNPAVLESRRQETSPFLSMAANAVELGGGTQQKNDLQVDGSGITAGYKSSYVPNTDAIQEVNVQQNSVDAEVGHSAGGIISMTLKSGTNEWHGNAFWVHREPNWNAITDRTTRSQSGQRNNIFGGTLGNPIIKNKLFNFASFEIWRLGSPGQVIWTMPTDLERQGDFSQSLNVNGELRKIYDPFSTVVSGGVVTRTQFPDNKIPANRIDPIAAKVIAALWKPNRTPSDITGTDNFTASYVDQTKYWNLSDRADWFVNDKLRIYGRYSIFKSDTDTVDSLLSPNEFYFPKRSFRNAYSYSGDGIWTASATTVLNFHYAWHQLHDDSANPDKDLGPGGLSKYWASNWYKPFEQNEFPTFFPAFTFGTATVGHETTSIGRSNSSVSHPGGWSWYAKISQQRGSHFLKSGFEMRHGGGVLSSGTAYSFLFSPNLTANTYLSPNARLVGHQYATFLLGAIDNSGSSAAYRTPRQMEVNMYAAYFQDDWKLNRRITLNLGLRYEVDTPWKDPDNRGVIGLDLTKVNSDIQADPPVLPDSVIALRTADPIWNGYWNFASPDRPGIWEMQKFVLMPRIGMALRVNDLTALRIGWARFVIPSDLNYVTGIPGAKISFLDQPYLGYDSVQNPLALNNGVPQQTISDPFPSSNPLSTPIGSAYGQYYGLGESNVNWANPNFKRGVNDRVNVTFSRQLPNQIVAELTYFANFGRDLSVYPRDLNAWDPSIGYNLPTASKSTMDKSVPNPFYNYHTAATYPGPSRNNKNIATKQLLRPYPQYGGLWVGLQSNQGERYHALQLKVQRPFQNGYNFLFGYNYRREKLQGYYDELDQYLNKLTWLDDPTVPGSPSTYGPAAPHHSMSIAGTYEIPFGRSRMFGTSMPKALDVVIGGWQLIGAWYFNSGNILVFGPMVVTGDPSLDNPTPEKWFDTSKFSPLPSYTQRTNPRTYPGLNGPIYWEIQASIGKTIPVREQFKAQFKLAAYNLTNRLNRADPVTDITQTTFGTALRQGNGMQTGVFSGRQLEFSMKILF